MPPPPTYVEEVRRYAGRNYRLDTNGNTRNIAHDTDFAPEEVKTDGVGNIVDMPLLLKKGCFGRPERFYKGTVGGKIWRNKDGIELAAQTSCNRCAEKTPGVFNACANVVDERVASNPEIKRALEAWMTSCDLLRPLGFRHFHPPHAKFWQAFVDAILASRGWTSVNEDQVRLHERRRAEQQREQRNRKAREKRRKAREARKAARNPLPDGYLEALDEERDRRAVHLKSLRCLNGASKRDMMWLKNLPDETCERIADVWAARELLTAKRQDTSNMAIAAFLIKTRPRYHKLQQKSLAARVGEDIKKRLDRLEDLRGKSGQPVWAGWKFEG